MKIYLMLLTLLLVYSRTHAQQKVTTPDFPTPPNGAWIDNNLYLDKTEVANIHWLEYLHYLKKEETKEAYISALPDTTVWEGQDTSQLGAYRDFYLRYPGFRFHPVVGITATQANNYCLWRSKKVSDEFTWKHKNWDVEFRYRLPNALEWEHAVSKGNTKAKPLQTPTPGYIYDSQPNDVGIYNLLGNASELVQGGIVKGPVMKVWSEKAPMDMEIPFSSPNRITGFRCICEVVLKHKSVVPPVAKASFTSNQFLLDEQDQVVVREDQSPRLSPFIASDTLIVEAENWQNNYQKLTLLNTSNQIVVEYPMRKVCKQAIKLDRLTPGIYTATIEDGNLSYSRKIVVRP